MGKYRFFLMEVKRNMGVLWRFTVFFISIFVLTAFAFINICGGYSDDSKEIVKIGIAYEDQAEDVSVLTGYLNQLKSIRGFCRLETGRKDEVFSKMEDGYYSIVIDIPVGFFEKADRMEETSFKVYAVKGLAAEKLITLISSAQRVMLTTEAGIKAVYDGMDEYTFTMPKHQMEDVLTNLYIMQFLNRDSFFDTEYLSAYGGYDALEYMAFGWLLAFVILFLPCFFNQMDEQGRMVERLLAGGFSGRISILIIKTAALTLPLFFMLIFLVTGLWYADIIEPDSGCIFRCLMAASVMSLYVIMMVRIFQGSAYKKSLFFVINLLGIIVSGLVVPGIFLPDFVRESGRLYIFAALHRLMLLCENAGDAWISVCHAAVCVIVMTGITIAAEYYDRG